jgi:carboxymethylenebutenolidase
VLGLYGGSDARVDATVGPAAQEMKRLGKSFEYTMFEGAGHGFVRAQDGMSGANLKATQQAWPRVVRFLKQNLVSAVPFRDGADFRATLVAVNLKCICGRRGS